MSQVNDPSVNSHYARIGMISEGKQASSVVRPMKRQNVGNFKPLTPESFHSAKSTNGSGYITMKNAYGNNCSQTVGRNCAGNVN